MTKLYHHKTDGGAEYLTDTFVKWTHNGKSGREGTVNEKTRILIRLDGKPELVHNAAEDDRAALLQALKAVMREFVGDRNAENCLGGPGEIADLARAAIAKAEG